MLNIRKSLIKTQSKGIYKSPEIEEVISTIKKTKSTENNSSFMDEFKYPIENKTIKNGNIPMKLTPINKEILSKSIVISPYDLDLSHRGDLEFIGNSRITGRGIYRYVGVDFSKFELEYDEIFVD
jgi:hypothetical protein